MQFIENQLYHIYNRGNNQQPIFFDRQNYLYFLANINKFIFPHADILAWTLMPNHFHLLIHANRQSIFQVRDSPVAVNALTEGIRLTLSSYTKALQKQRSFTGSLFQQKTKSKCIDDGTIHYGSTTFHYIHQNAYKAQLVSKIEDWEFSSFPDYIGIRDGKLCNKELAYSLLDIQPERLYNESYRMISSEVLSRIFKPGNFV